MKCVTWPERPPEHSKNNVISSILALIKKKTCVLNVKSTIINNVTYCVYTSDGTNNKFFDNGNNSSTYTYLGTHNNFIIILIM